MATYNVTLSMTGSNVTQNVATGDTINYTVNGGGFLDGSIVVASSSGCTVNHTSLTGLGPATGTVTGFTAGGSYSVVFQQELKDNAGTYQVILSGSVAGISGTLTPAVTGITEQVDSAPTFTANVDTTTTIYWDLERKANQGTSANTVSFAAPTSGSLAVTANTNKTFTIGEVQSNTTCAIGFRGVEFTVDLFTGANRTGTLIDSSDYTVYENQSGITVNSTEVFIEVGATYHFVGWNQAHTVSNTYAGTSAIPGRIYNVTDSQQIRTFSVTSYPGNQSLQVTTTPPTNGTPRVYRIDNSNVLTYLQGGTYTVYYNPIQTTNATNKTISQSYNSTLGITMENSSTQAGAEAYAITDTYVANDNALVVANRLTNVYSGGGFADSNSTGNTVFGLSAADLPTSGTKSFYIYAYRRSTYGGYNLYYYRDTFTVTRTQDPDLTVTFSDFITSLTSLSNRTLGGGTNGENYRLVRIYSGTATVNQVVDTITNYNSSSNTTFNISSTYMPPEGTTGWYKVQAQRPTSASPPGDGTWQDTNISGNSSAFIRKQNAVPTFTVSDDNAASADVGIRVNVTNNSSFTPDSVRVLQLLNGAANGSEVALAWTGNGVYDTGLTQPRNIGSDEYKYRVRVYVNGVSGATAVPNDQIANSSSTASGFYSSAYDAGYLTPDLSASVAIDRRFISTATSLSYDFISGGAGDSYQLRRYNGTTVVGTATADGSGNFSISVSSTHLPANQGDTIWYRMYAAKPTTIGGSGSYQEASVSLLYLSRRLATPTFTVSDNDAASTTVTIIQNITNTSTVTPTQVWLRQYKNGSQLGSTQQVAWTGNGNYTGYFTQPRNTGSDTYYYNCYMYYQGTGSTPENRVDAYSYSRSEPSGSNYQAGYINPDVAVSPSAPSIGPSDTQVTVTVNNVTSGEEYQVRNQAGTASYQSAVASSTTVQIVLTSGLPAEGQPLTYQIYSRRPEAIGGDNSYDATGDFFTVSRDLTVVAPTASNVTVDNVPTATGYTATFNLSDAGQGGTLQYSIEKNDSTPDVWINAASDTQTTFTADFSRSLDPGTIYAQARRSASETSAIVSVAGTGFILPSNPTVANPPEVSATSTSNVTVTLTGCTTDVDSPAAEVYSIVPDSISVPYDTNDNDHVIDDNNVVNNRIDNQLDPTFEYASSNGTTTVNFEILNSELPAAGQSRTFRVYRYRRGTSGGRDDYYRGNTFTITRAEATGGSAPISRDHGNSEWVAMVNATINYVAENTLTTIYQKTPAGSVTTLFQTSANDPQAGTFSVTAGNTYYANKAVNFWDQGAQYTIIPTTLLGKLFASYANRNANGTFYFYSSTAGSIEVWDNIVPLSGTPTTTITLPAKTVVTYTRTALSSWIYFSSDVNMVVSTTQNGADRMAVPPMGDYVYRARNSFEIAADNAAPSTAGTYVVYDSADQVSAVEISDGAGGDSSHGLPDKNLSQYYLFGQALSDFTIVAPNSNIIVVEEWDGNAWAEKEVISLTNGIASSPAAVLRDGTTGFGSAGSINSGTAANFTAVTNIWRWRGTNVFYLRINDASDDEESLFGYTPVLTAPVISSVTDNNAESASVTVTVNLSSTGSGGTLKYARSLNTTPPATGWQSTNTFSQDRGDSYYYFASRNEALAGAYDTSAIKPVNYISAATIDCSNVTNLTVETTTLNVPILNGVQTKEVYAVSATSGLSSANVAANSIDVINPYNGSGFTISGADLPAQSSLSSKTYYLYALRLNTYGGAGSYSEVGSFTITRADATAAAFTFTDVTNSPASQEQNTYVQITGITQSVTVSRTAGTGTFAVSSSTTTPTSGFSSTAKTISNNQYIHVKNTSSATSGGSVSTTISAGGQSDTWNITTTTQSATFIVSVLYEGSFEGQIISFSVSGPTSGRTGQNSASAIRIVAGQTVGFQHNSNPALVTMDVNNFDQFTNNTSISNLPSGTLSTIKQWNSGVSPGTIDSLFMYIGGVSETVYFRQEYISPDLSVTFINPVEIGSSATSFVQTITETSPNQNSAITEYAIYATDNLNTFLGSRTGPGNITINDVPTFLGVPEGYQIKARITTANGGDNLFYSIGVFEVVRGTAPGANPPTKDAYGIGIYDEQGTFVTSFTESSTILREIFKGSTTTSTTQNVTVNTGLTGLSSSNCLISLTKNGGTSGDVDSALNLPSRIVSGTSVEIARTTTAIPIDVSVLQYSGATISNSTPPDYGINIYNKAGDLVIDDLASCYAVREIINLNPANSNVTVATGYTSIYVTVTLVENRYPFSGGLPVPAIQGPGLSLLIPPKVNSVGYTSSYRYVTVTLDRFANPSNFNLAILTERTSSEPSYYGGTAPAYGLKVLDGSGNTTWHSGWRQAIVNNVISANQFTAGVSQNGTYDVTTGTDGVNAPYVTSGDYVGALETTAEVKEITGLNDMDPLNTFLIGGGLVTGYISYYKGRYNDFEHNISFDAGGGKHVPAITVTGNSSVTITMRRLEDGPTPPTVQDRGTRLGISYHPEGYFVLARIT